MDLEARLDRIEDALVRLVEAQARTEQRLGEFQVRVEERFAALAERVGTFEVRTEERFAALAERVGTLEVRTEERFAALAERVGTFEVRTEERFAALAGAVTTLTQQVGRLSEAVGFTLGDLARELAPSYLARHWGIEVGALERRFFAVGAEEVEIDLYGEGHRDGEPVTVLGEVKSYIHGRDVERMAARATQLAPQLASHPIVLLFGFVIHPSARARAQEIGALVISSIGRS